MQSRAEPAQRAQPSGLWSRLPEPLHGASIAAAALPVTALATGAGMVLARWLPQQSLGLVFILAVVTAAAGLGTRTGLAVAVLSFLAYNFFFIPPVYTFTIADPGELFALVVFLAVALMTGSLAGRMREAADAARTRAAGLQSLGTFAAQLSGSRSEDAILAALRRQASDMLGAEVAVLAARNDEPEIVAGTIELTSADIQAARRVMRTGDAAYPVAAGWDGSRVELHAIGSGSRVAAILAIRLSFPARAMSQDARTLLDTMLQHTAIALERTELEQAAREARDETERERLRSALLSSLSHDLRTPLASIVGAVTSLRQLGTGMSQETRDDLLAAIEEEAERLSLFVTNLLEMTRLEAGGIDLAADWIDLGDVVRTAVARAQLARPAPIIRASLPAALPAIRGDATLLEHVVLNLLDNSIKHSDGPARIEVDLTSTGPELVLTVTDQGRGVSPDVLPRVFEPFFRDRSDGGSPAGMGLGLAIAKRIVEGMGGSIGLHSPVAGSRGTRVVVTLPVHAAGAATGPDRTVQ